MTGKLVEAVQEIIDQWPTRTLVLEKFEGNEQMHVLMGMLAGDLGKCLRILNEQGKLPEDLHAQVLEVIEKGKVGEPSSATLKDFRPIIDTIRARSRLRP